jgi:hypothetical protein
MFTVHASPWFWNPLLSRNNTYKHWLPFWLCNRYTSAAMEELKWCLFLIRWSRANWIIWKTAILFSYCTKKTNFGIIMRWGKWSLDWPRLIYFREYGMPDALHVQSIWIHVSTSNFVDIGSCELFLSLYLLPILWMFLDIKSPKCISCKLVILYGNCDHTVLSTW